MGVAETEMLGVVALICLVTSVAVRLWASFAQKEQAKTLENPQNHEGICQTMGTRELQADRVQVQRSSAGILAVASDGIGKMNTGQVCAQIAVDTVLDRFEPYAVLNQPDYFFRTAFYEANQRIQATLGERRGGASLGAVFINSNYLSYAIAGNIRIALFRGGELIPLSKGHTLDILAVEAWKNGKISRQEALWSMEEKRLWNYLGMDGFHEIEIGYQPVQTKAEDVVLLVTCGIFEELSWRDMEDILVGSESLQRKAEAMIQAAEQKEGLQKENGSVILLQVPEAGGKSDQYGGMA